MIDAIKNLNHKDDWETPKEVFKYIEEYYLRGKFNIDLAADKQNTKCKEYIDEQTDLFDYDVSKLKNNNCWLNPPYSKKSKTKKYSLEDFFIKAMEIRLLGNTVAILSFSNITSNRWFDELVGNTEFDRANNDVELYFVSNRIQFLNNGIVQSGNPFASMVVIFRQVLLSI